MDPETLAVDVRPVIGRSATGFQAALFDLDASPFLSPEGFRVSSVAFTPRRDVALTFTHSHPWKAPDVTAPPSALNRADLGYTGRLLILSDLSSDSVASHTFFGNVFANTETVLLPDGYVQPGGLLNLPGHRANCFPYVLLADEAKDNRLGVSNQDAPVGTWDLASGGWQRGNLGPSRIGWTGFDFVHAGQTVSNSFVLRNAHLESADALRVALLIKHSEPKGIGGSAGRNLRLPPATVDVSQFAYRAPHGALDCSVVRRMVDYRESDLTMHVQENGPGSPIGFAIRDWDMTMPEAPSSDLSLHPDISAVVPGAAGSPLVDLDIPGVLGTPQALNEVLPLTSGMPGQEFVFATTIGNELGAPALTDHPALVRVTDREATLSDAGPHAGLTPGTLAPDPALAMPPVTYQGFNVRIVPPEPQWQKMVVDPGPLTGEWNSLVHEEHGPGVADDRIALAYYDRTLDRLKIARSTRPDPRTTADWTIHLIEPDNESGRGVGLVLWNGRLACSYYDYTLQDLRFARALTADPQSPTDWQRTTIQPGAIDRSAMSGRYWDETDLIVNPDGGLSLTFERGPVAPSPNDHIELAIAHSITADPQGFADWWIYSVGVTQGADGGSSDTTSDYVDLETDGIREYLLFSDPLEPFVPPYPWDFLISRDPVPFASERWAVTSTGYPTNWTYTKGDSRGQIAIVNDRIVTTQIGWEGIWRVSTPVSEADRLSDLRWSLDAWTPPPSAGHAEYDFGGGLRDSLELVGGRLVSAHVQRRETFPESWLIVSRALVTVPTETGDWVSTDSLGDGYVGAAGQYPSISMCDVQGRIVVAFPNNAGNLTLGWNLDPW